jgi:membrane-bound ClpP family serine protease
MPNWNEILNEINGEIQKGINAAQNAQDNVRRRYLGQLFNYIQPHRNIIAYYSGFLSKPAIEGIEINDEDKNGFMTAVNKLDKSLGLDLILHTPGGSLAATESIVDYLRRIFGTNIRAIVPQIAMSAGTMIACSCRSIVMGKQSNLGPVDPQYGQISAAGVIEEFEKAFKEIKLDPDKAKVWQFIIGRYAPSFLGQCENAVERAKNFARTCLESNMLSALPNKGPLAESIVKELTDFTGNKGHDRHIHYDECARMGLQLEPLEGDQTLQDLVLSVHHCYMNSLMNTLAYKIIENHNGVAVIKMQQQQVQFGQLGQKNP